MPDGWKFEWVIKWDEIESPRFMKYWDEWIATADQTHVFNHPALAYAWLSAYRSIWRLEPRFLFAECSGRKIFFPLLLRHTGWKDCWQRIMVPLGHHDFDYHDPMVISGALENWNCFWNALEREIRRTWRRDCDTVVVSGITSVSAGAGASWSPGETCPIINLSSHRNVESLMSGPRRKKVLADVRRQIRRLEETGNLSFDVFTADQADGIKASIKHFLQNHSERWPHSFKAPGLHEALILEGLKARILHFSELRLDNQTISWRLAFLYNGIFYFYMPAFLASAKQFSPGKVHQYFCVRDAMNRGVIMFDHLRGKEPYKDHWANEYKSLSTWCFHSNGPNSFGRNVAVKHVKPFIQRHLIGRYL